jgi:hypothetical protein
MTYKNKCKLLNTHFNHDDCTLMLTEDFHDSSAVLALISHSKVISFVWCSLLHYPMILFFKEELLELIFYTCSHFEEMKITKCKKYLKLLSKISNIEFDLFFFYFFKTLDKQIIFSCFVQIVFTRFDFCIGSVFYSSLLGKS